MHFTRICLYSVIFAVVSFITLPVAAQQHTGIHGTVTGSGKPIVGATLRLLELDRTAHTDSRGAYSFPNVPNGSYTLFVQVIGYSSTSSMVQVKDSVTEVSFTL